MDQDHALSRPPGDVPGLAEATRTFAKIGLLSFGGPAGQIALMHRVLVDEKRWVDEERFLHALNYCMLLPGPEAQQLATYVGWMLHRVRGGLIAGSLFVLPGFVTMLLLSWLYVAHGDLRFVTSLFFGIKAAVLAVVLEASLRIGRRAFRRPAHWVLASLSFVAVFFFGAPFPFIVLGAGLLGLWLSRGQPSAPAVAPAVRPSRMRALRVLLVCALLWVAPLLLLLGTLGAGHVLLTEGVFFSKAAVVTFGGAYAVLTYLAQQAVEVHGWLAPGEMLDGLGLAETTPGPLIMVVQFVGYLGAYRNPGPFEPWLAGLLGAAVTTWVTFVPCFLWIFLGAPYVEALRGNRRVSGALTAITAAVVGVIANLAVWFALHVLFGAVDERFYGPLRLQVPDPVSLDVAALALAVLAGVALLRFRVGMLLTILGCAVAGLLYGLVFTS